MKPEEQARQRIDALLTQAGWLVQDYATLNLGAARGVAIREYPLSTGPTDYLLVVDRQAVGVIEAKKAGETLTGVEAQSAKYREGRPGVLPMARVPLPFAYESTGVETRFTNGLDPEPRSRPVFAFHRPETLADWLTQTPAMGENQLMRAAAAPVAPAQDGFARLSVRGDHPPGAVLPAEPPTRPGADGNGEWQDLHGGEQRLAETEGHRHGSGHAVICCMSTPVSVVSLVLPRAVLSLPPLWP